MTRYSGAALLLAAFALGGGVWRGTTPLAATPATAGGAAPAPDACPLCVEDPGVPVVRITAVQADSLAREYDRHNRAALSHLDSLLCAGDFGPPASARSQQTARTLAGLVELDIYDYVFRFATDSTCVHEVDGAALAGVFRNYSDAGLFPIARLRRARLGLGRMCVQYDLRQPVDSVTCLGGKQLRLSIQDFKIEGRKRRMLSMDLPTSLSAVVEVLLAEHYCCEVERTRIEGATGSYDLFLVHHIQGGWLRKFGTHRPEAFMLWRTPCDSSPRVLPDRPLKGVRIYIPHLRLHLPSIVPDIGFDDLREIEPPQPILSVDYYLDHRHPDWLKVDSTRLGFADWLGFGPLPAAIRQRFPDL